MRSVNCKSVDWARLEAADPLIQVIDDLNTPVAILRAVFLALGNPDTDDIGYRDDCLRALEYATDQIAVVRKEAGVAVNMIRKDA